MNRIPFALLLFLVIQPTIAQQPPVGPVFLSRGSYRAETYLEMPPAQQIGYAEGFVDGMYLAPDFGANSSDKVLVAMEECIDGRLSGGPRMDGKQLVAIIEKSLRESPEHWHENLDWQAFSALYVACQIKQRVPDPKDRHFLP